MKLIILLHNSAHEKKWKKNIAFILPKNCARINVFCFLIDDREDKEKIEKKEGEHRICFFFKLEKKMKNSYFSNKIIVNRPIKSIPRYKEVHDSLLLLFNI